MLWLPRWVRAADNQGGSREAVTPRPPGNTATRFRAHAADPGGPRGPPGAKVSWSAAASVTTRLRAKVRQARSIDVLRSVAGVSARGARSAAVLLADVCVPGRPVPDADQDDRARLQSCSPPSTHGNKNASSMPLAAACGRSGLPVADHLAVTASEDCRSWAGRYGQRLLPAGVASSGSDEGAMELDLVPRYRAYRPVMRSSEVASRAGVNVQTLRYYERRGILPEPQRSESGYRAYDAQAVRTVRFVKCAQQLGFSLEEIDSLLELAAGGPANCDAAKTLATGKIGELEAKIASLSAMCDSLRRLVATAAASAWATEHPDGQVLTIAAAFQECRASCEELGWLDPEGADR